jgi:hypothetical protein
MKVGDTVVISESFGGGVPYIGKIAVVERLVHVKEGGITYHLEVYVDNKIYICNAVHATDLIKALV